MKLKANFVSGWFSRILIGLLLTSPFFPLISGTTGKIVGRVIDKETGEGLPGANIVLLGTTMGASADEDGDYIILNVPPGKYDLQASMLGYHDQTMKNVVVRVDLTTKASFKLSSEAISGQEVVVSASKEMVTPDMTASQSVVNSQQIEQLPVEEFSDVVALQAGVVQGRDGKLHIRGGRSDEIVYMVDGVALSDVYSGDIAVEVENSSVQELQVISGTFNAEYGRALSGIVNIVSKAISPKMSGSFTFYNGDYTTNHTNTFPHISNFNVSGIQNYQFNLQGAVPFTKNKIRFLLSSRYLYDKGYIWGTRIFNPSDSSNVSFDDPSKFQIQHTGNGDPVPMKPFKKTSIHGKLEFQIFPMVNLSSSLFYSHVKTKDWSKEGEEFTPENQFHDFYRFMWDPDGSSNQYRDSYTLLTSLNHVLNKNTFYNFNFSVIHNNEKSYVYKDPFDPRYVHPDRLLGPLSAGNTFYTGGTDMWHSERTTNTIGLKFDFTSQVTKTHQFKAGLEYRSHKLDFLEFKLIPLRVGGVEVRPFRTAIPPRISPFNNRYTKRPKEFAAYIQDKMEFESLIVNLGIRYDLFDPNSVVPTDLGDPANPDKFKQASVKSLVSPRLGIAYPISARGILHFSAGKFFQMPLFQFLYANSEFEVQIGRLQTLMGNADLEAQKTTVYEVGLQQQLSDNLAVDVTVFSKDIRDLLGTEIDRLTKGADQYARYVNKDFGTARGFTVSITQRASNWFSAAVDYTLLTATGNASDPNAGFISRRANRQAENRLVPLDWDQRHTLNASVTFSKNNKFNLTFLGRYGTGLPYTPKFLNVLKALENSARSASTLTVDIKSNYSFTFGGQHFSAFLKIFNLFDRKNEVIVYPSTGRAGFNLEYRQSSRPKGLNTIEQFVFNPPFHYSAPRQIRLGLTVDIK